MQNNHTFAKQRKEEAAYEYLQKGHQNMNSADFSGRTADASLFFLFFILYF